MAVIGTVCQKEPQDRNWIETLDLHDLFVIPYIVRKNPRIETGLRLR